MKRLPIKIDADIMTECWTYYRLAILQAYENGRRWLASHVEVFMRDMAADFGTNNEAYSLDYYSGILAYEEINIWRTPADKIIDTIVNTIDQGYYVILNLPTHETLFYGYDETKRILYTTCLNNHGVFVETSMTFDYVIDGYKRCLEMVKANPILNISRRFYHFIISKIRIRSSDYVPDNDLFNCFEKIRHEANGAKSTVQWYNESGSNAENRTFYFGLSCLIGFAEGLDVTRQDFLNFHQENPGRIRKTLRTLFEHRKIILDSMNWVIDELKIDQEVVLRARDTYKKCTQDMQRQYLRFMKYEMTGQEDRILKFKNQFVDQYVREKTALLAFQEKAMNLFGEKEATSCHENNFAL